MKSRRNVSPAKRAPKAFNQSDLCLIVINAFTGRTRRIFTAAPTNGLHEARTNTPANSIFASAKRSLLFSIVIYKTSHYEILHRPFEFYVFRRL